MKITMGKTSKDPGSLKTGDFFIDNEGDLNLVLAYGEVVLFDGKTGTPWVRGLNVDDLVSHGFVQRVLEPGETVTFTQE